MKRFSLAIRGLLVSLLATLGIIAFAAPVEAITRPIHIVGTGGAGVNIRPTPNTSQPRIGVIPEGASPQYLCYERGVNIGGTDVWFKVNWNGVVGFYTSYYDDVPLVLQSNLEGNYGISRCQQLVVAPPVTANTTVLPAPTIYHRQAAAAWALQHAQDARPFNRFADCTWFVSQALWNGSFHQTSGWNGYENHGFKLWPIPGTVSATVAHELVNYLRANVPMNVVPLSSSRFRNNAVPEAEVGDVIAYDWDNNNHIDHLALVTNIAPGSYPEVSEWGTGWPTVGYQKRGWTWSANNNRWLQVDNPRVTAQLLHFTVRTY